MGFLSKLTKPFKKAAKAISRPFEKAISKSWGAITGANAQKRQAAEYAAAAQDQARIQAQQAQIQAQDAAQQAQQAARERQSSLEREQAFNQAKEMREKATQGDQGTVDYSLTGYDEEDNRRANTRQQFMGKGSSGLGRF